MKFDDGLEINSALAIYAHPDDNEWNSGGTIASWVRQGVEVNLVLTTNGASGSSDPEMTRAKLTEIRMVLPPGTSIIAETMQLVPRPTMLVPCTFIAHSPGELHVSNAHTVSANRNRITQPCIASDLRRRRAGYRRICKGLQRQRKGRGRDEAALSASRPAVARSIKRDRDVLGSRRSVDTELIRRRSRQRL